MKAGSLKAATPKKAENWRNIASFWIFGFCKTFTFVVMLTAAQDVLSKSKEPTDRTNTVIHQLMKNSNGTIDNNQRNDDACLVDVSHRKCFEHSAGIILICNIFPSLIIKIIAPFYLEKIPYALGIWVLCIGQAIASIIIAMSNVMWINLVGVALGSLSNGAIETLLMAMTALYHKETIGGWASGTGLAGVVSSFFYSLLTDSRIFGLSPSIVILLTVVIPVTNILTYYFLLIRPAQTDRKAMRMENITNENDETPNEPEPISKLQTFQRVFKFIVMFVILYFAQYFVNQGLLELTIYDCAHSFGEGPLAQYRWYQVLYQWGVFISRSSKQLMNFGVFAMLTFPWLQMLLSIVFLMNTMFVFIPHFGIAAFMVFMEGILGGIAYVNVFDYVHRKTPPHVRAYAISIVSPAGTLGIVLAAFGAIPAHNLICRTTPQTLWIL